MDNALLKLENEFNSILLELDGITDENFFKKFDRIKFLQNKIKEDRKILLFQFEKKELVKYSFKFDILIKQISKKFDDMLLERKKRQKEVSSKLNRLLNHKKLVNYQR